MSLPAEPAEIVLETQRLLVRRIIAADLEAMYAVYGDAETMRWVDDGRPLSRSQCAEWITVTRRNYATRGYGMFSIGERQSFEVIGFCGLVHPGGQPAAEIKYALRRVAWGKGYASEVAEALLGHAAKEYGLRRVIATAAPENIASHRVLLKAGMIEDGRRWNDDGSSTRLFVWSSGRRGATRPWPDTEGGQK